MGEIVYDSGKMDISGKRHREKVRKTRKGIIVEHDTLYDDEFQGNLYYRDGNYPELPNDWSKADNWFWQLRQFKPDRVMRR